MPKYKVRPGYVLKIGHVRYHENNIVDVSEKEIADQLWKVELAPEEVAREEPVKVVVAPTPKVSRVSKNRAITKTNTR
jgi:hypothetical protein